MMQIPACRDRSDMGYVGFLIGSEAMTDALFLLDTDHDDVPVNSDELNAGWRLTLPSSVRRHAIQAMRLKDGDELQLSLIHISEPTRPKPISGSVLWC